MGRGLRPGGMRPLPRDRQTLRLAGWAEYGYCASHSRFFWSLRPHLVCHPCCGLPVKVDGSGLAQPCSSRCDRSSNRSTRPSRGSLTSNCTQGAHLGGVIARVMQRILALIAAIWHNEATGQTVLRSLIAYDH